MSKPAAAAKAAPTVSDSAQVAPAPAAPMVPMVPLLAGQMVSTGAGVHFNEWEVVPNAGTPFEHLLKPSFWANVAIKLKPGDEIKAFPRDGAWCARLVVWNSGRSWAQVSGTAEMRPAFDAAPDVEEEFDVFRDPLDGWCVKRRASGAILSKSHADAEEARRWILDHQRALRN